MGLAAISPAVIASWLPITEDVDEADHIYTFFAVLITRCDRLPNLPTHIQSAHLWQQ